MHITTNLKKFDLIRYLVLFIGALLMFSCQSEKENNQATVTPNIIYIFTDQQSASMMSCANNPWLNTPAMDYIANNGIRFTHAYTPNPVCAPSRVSLMTGRFPSYFNDDAGNPVRGNPGAVRIPSISSEVEETTLAAFLKKAGYDLIFGGKEHLPTPLTPTTLGFNDITDNERDELVEKTVDYINTKPENPYFMVVSLINPHDICYMAIRDFAETDREKRLLETGTVELATLDEAMKMPEGVTEEEFFDEYCPPLPPNYESQQGEPEAIKVMLEESNFRNNARDHWGDKDWRRHRWAYCRLTEVVDQQIQVILDALKASGQEENTLILFSSDHGDMDASHRMEHKSTLYEESSNVPFLAMWKDHIPAGQVDSTHLISTGLDLLPTVCDYAGIKGVADPRGKSLRPLLEGNAGNWRKTLGVESQIGKMVVSEDRYKFIRYDKADIEEQLLDLNKDPYETTHFTDSTSHADKLNELREIYETQWFSSE